MRLDGSPMVIQLKDTAKLIGISIIICCAVFICMLFLNFYLDITDMREAITSPMAMQVYEGQVSIAKAISAVSGGCLFVTSCVMLFFYIKHYIDVHKKELGILKAMGYSNFQVAKHFWIFGISVLIGALIGYFASFLLMPTFYEAMNEEGFLPEIAIQFHLILFFCMVVLPTLVFSLIAVLYAARKLTCSSLSLLQGKVEEKTRKQPKPSKKDAPFLEEMKKGTLRSKKSLVFFIGFSAFCFASMMQMSVSMKEISTVMFAAILVIMGAILSLTTLLLANTTVVNGNIKNIAMMKVFGYSLKECKHAVLDGYRIVAYIGFGIGTIYQYVLLKLMLSLFAKDLVDGMDVSFDIPVFFIVLIIFVILYEGIMQWYTRRIQHISIKEIMLDA